MVRDSDGEGLLGTLGPFTGCAVGCARDPHNPCSCLEDQFPNMEIGLVAQDSRGALLSNRVFPAPTRVVSAQYNRDAACRACMKRAHGADVLGHQA